MIDKKNLFTKETWDDVRAHGLEDEYIAVLLKLPYRMWFIHDVNTSTWTCGITEFPGCISEGDSLTDAHSMLMDAADGWLHASLELGHVIPKPEMDLED